MDTRKGIVSLSPVVQFVLPSLFLPVLPGAWPVGQCLREHFKLKARQLLVIPLCSDKSSLEVIQSDWLTSQEQTQRSTYSYWTANNHINNGSQHGKLDKDNAFIFHLPDQNA